MPWKKINRFKLLGIILILVFLFGNLYLQRYQRMVNDGIALFDERCFSLEPIIAKKKELALEWANSYTSSESEEIRIQLYEQYYEDYFNLVGETINFSEPWLNKAKAYINRWDFQFFTDKRIEEKILAILDKYNADYSANIAVKAYFEDPENEEAVRELGEAVNFMHEKQKVLDEKVEAAKDYSDIRGSFVRVSLPKCEESVEDSPFVPFEQSGQTG